MPSRDARAAAPVPADRPSRRGFVARAALVATASTLVLGSLAACGRSTDEGTAGTGSNSGATNAAGAPVAGNGSPTTAPPATAAATTTVEPGTLPQTETKPTLDSADFNRRVQAMWQGIVDDDPKKAQEFFFPLSAYKQVKSLQDPTSDWNSRLIAIYDSEIHALHSSLGKDPSKAKFEGIDVPMQNATWINPNVEYNKLGYWRVYGTKVRYSVNGVQNSFVVQSLISWRGEWYVVHLTAPPR